MAGMSPGGTGNPRQNGIDGLPNRKTSSGGTKPSDPLDGMPEKSLPAHQPNKEGFKGRPRID